MTKTTRRTAAAMAAAIACALLLVGATSAPAAAPSVESYDSGGEARGLDVSFTFTGSIFERLVDLGIPRAGSDVNSEGDGTSRGIAAQIFPGDLVIGATGESFPGYRQAVYPQETKADAPDDSHFSDTFQLPGVIDAKALVVDTGRLKTTADTVSGSGLVTTNLVSLGIGAPLFTVRSIDSRSTSVRAIDHVDHVATTIAHGIHILVSPQLILDIGALVAQAHTTSDGASPTAETSLKLSDVSVLMNGTRYQATIDDTGVHIVGAPQVALPSPLSGDLIPSDITQTANHTLGVLLDQANVQIAAAQGTKLVDDQSSDASLSGLLVTFTGIVPNVFVPSIVYDLVYQQVVPRLPKAVQDQLNKSICYERDIKPHLPKQLVNSLPDLPLCASPQIIPGPGSGVVTTFSIGKVHSQSVAVQAENFVEPPSGGSFDGGFPPPPLGGGLGGGLPGGYTQQPGGSTGTSGTPPVLTGLVARLPSAVLYAVGAAFFVLAMALAVGPSLRRWRAIPEL